MKTQGLLDLIVIDYLQLINGTGKGRGSEASRQQEISDISRALKGLARELDVPVIALHNYQELLKVELIEDLCFQI